MTRPTITKLKELAANCIPKDKYVGYVDALTRYYYFHQAASPATILKLCVAIEKAVGALEKSDARFRFIRNHQACIGKTLVHTDGNCPHCLAEYSASDCTNALAEIERGLE